MTHSEAKRFKQEVLKVVEITLKQEFTGTLMTVGDSCEVRDSDGKSVSLIVKNSHASMKMFVVTIKEVM